MTKTRRNVMAVAVAMIAAIGAGGCKSQMEEQNALLLEENNGLRQQLSERNAALDAAQAELREREARIAQLERDGDASGRAMEDPFAGIAGVKGSLGAGEVTATVESDVLFDSGKASLKQAAKRSLDQVAQVIVSKYPERIIRVAGHTDPDPIKKSGHKSNYHLGFERAYAVREYLISKGVPAKNVYVASHGPDQALATKAASRRVEIAVVLNE